MLRFGLKLSAALAVTFLLSACWPNKEQAYDDFCLFHPHACDATNQVLSGYENARDEFNHTRRQISSAIPEQLK